MNVNIYAQKFAKNELGNIRTDELVVLKRLVAEMLAQR